MGFPVGLFFFLIVAKHRSGFLSRGVTDQIWVLPASEPGSSGDAGGQTQGPPA